MISFIIDERLFQRGQTWESCIESWLPEREDFLRRVKHAPLLQGLTGLGECEDKARIAVYFNPHLEDTRRALPALAAGLEHGGVTARYFEEDIFFPDFFTPFGRARVILILLAPDGSVERTWQMTRGAGEREDDARFLARLENEIAARFATAGNPEAAEPV